MKERILKEAVYYDQINEGTVRCRVCAHNCNILQDAAGICGVRRNREGKLWCEGYGRITSLALDPIEKKPLYHFYPGGKILSVGSYGCNFRCGFCQNHEISMGNPGYRMMTPEELAGMAKEYQTLGNIGLAYTYNEPFINVEFMRDCAELIAAQGQQNVVVTNGFVAKEPLMEMLPLIHAMNIDLKSFTPEFYRRIGGNLETVKDTIYIAAGSCHVELTTLIIPGENDSMEEMKQIAEWISAIDPAIPLHISRFFPAHEYWQKEPAQVERIYQLVDVAKQYLEHVYAGNL